MSSNPIPPLPKIILRPAPDRHDDPKQYQRNVEIWAREVQQHVLSMAETIRALVTKANGP